MISTFSKVSVFAVHTNRIGLCFQILHSGQGFKMYAFSMKMLSIFNRCSVNDRQKCIEKYAFTSENAKFSVDRAHVLFLDLNLESDFVFKTLQHYKLTSNVI